MRFTAVGVIAEDPYDFDEYFVDAFQTFAFAEDCIRGLEILVDPLPRNSFLGTSDMKPAECLECSLPLLCIVASINHDPLISS